MAFFWGGNDANPDANEANNEAINAKFDANEANADANNANFDANSTNHDANNDANIQKFDANPDANDANQQDNDETVTTIVLEKIAEQPYITQTKLSELAGVSRSTIQRITKSLSDQGKLERIGGTRGYWRAPPLKGRWATS